MQFSCEHCGRVFESQLASNGGLEFCAHCQKLNLSIPEGELSFVLLGDFKIEERIGSGGHSMVVRALHMPSGYTYALKLFFGQGTNETHSSEDFFQEVETASQLVHDNIVRIYEGGNYQNIMYIVMEYVDGMSLGDYLEVYGSMPPEDSTASMIHVCYALDYVWSNFLMIHRDVKPHNIIITSSGEIKLCDFGLTSSHETAVQESRNILGTPFYLSPEMIQTDIYQDNRSDIYSLGCTLYHLVVGSPPFNCGGILEVVNARLNNPPPDPREENPNCPANLATVIMTMMATDTNDRYATAFEVAADLIRVRNGETPHLVDPERARVNQ